MLNNYAPITGASGALPPYLEAAFIKKTVSGGVAHFVDGIEGVPLRKCKIQIGAVQSGSGDPSAENIRPFSGWDNLKLIACGKNLFNLADYAAANWRVYVPGEAAGYADCYYGNKHDFERMRGNVNSSNNALGLLPFRQNFGRLCTSLYKFYENVDKIFFHYKNGTAWNDATGNIPSIGRKLIVSSASGICDGTGLYSTQGSSANGAFGELQVEIDNKRTPYERFKGISTSIALGSMIYGGVFDPLSGILTVTHGEIDEYAGETLPGVWISDRDVYAEGTTPTIGAQVVYELETPVTYQLDPLEIVTQYGINNIFANTGDTTVEYYADATLAYEAQTAELQALILEQ